MAKVDVTIMKKKKNRIPIIGGIIGGLGLLGIILYNLGKSQDDEEEEDVVDEEDYEDSDESSEEE